MNTSITQLAVLLLILSGSGFAGVIDLRLPVRIESGLVAGVFNPQTNVVSFKGIPYAAPPVGELRWREPQPPVKWNGIRKGDRFGAPCVQPTSPSGKPAPADMSEDCLFLNIWSPAKSTTNHHAVLFFIHGGAGFFGSGNMNGEELAKKGIIVITLNYRLGLFAGMGHTLLTTESPHHACGNYGLLDLIAALNWVRDNISAFGGDPTKVTIAGQSSGACLVHYLTTSPLAQGLFHGVIAVSFPYDYLTKPNIIPFIRQKEDNGVEYARIKNTRSLEELRNIRAIDFVTDDPAIAKAKLNHLLSGVARDGWAFPMTYPDALDKGLASDVPTMTGMTADDFGPPAMYMKTTVASFAASVPRIPGQPPTALLALCPPVTTDDEARSLAKQLQIESGMVSIFNWAKRRAKMAKSPVYTYFFGQAVPSERGAYHGSDLAYWFNDTQNENRAWTGDDRLVADQASSYWVNFVATGNPNGNHLPVWKAFDVNSPTTMAIRKNPLPRPIAENERVGYYQCAHENHGK